MSTQTKAQKSKSQQTSASTEQAPRRVGRPRKTDSPNGTSTVSGAKSVATKRPRKSSRRSGISTRDLIIARANEIINRTGVVDFRIEILAKSLSLSPGNITYHFPKKEDIITAIWDEYIAVMKDTTAEMITPLLDIKQLFLYFRTSASKAINYVGVTTYYFGDIGTLTRDNAVFNRQVVKAREHIFICYEMLVKNGYMNPITNADIKELTFNSQMTMLRWWINHSLTKYPEQDLAVVVDRYVALSLLQLIPYLTEAGKRQFTSITNLIK